MERPKRGLSAFDDIERLDQLGEVGKRPRQPVDLVDDDHVDPHAPRTAAEGYSEVTIKTMAAAIERLPRIEG